MPWGFMSVEGSRAEGGGSRSWDRGVMVVLLKDKLFGNPCHKSVSYLTDLSFLYKC